MSDSVLCERKDGVARITLNRPDAFNAITVEFMQTLIRHLDAAEEDADTGVVVITGAGKAWCAGGDPGELGGIGNASINERRHFLVVFRNMIETVRRLSKPVIAAVNGYCIGGGNELHVACDLSIASEKAKFGQAGPRVGSIPVMGATQVMPMLVGEKRAKEIIFLCRTYTAEQAEKMGWINKVVPHDQLLSETEQWCRELLDKSSTSLAVSKKCINFYSNLAVQNMEANIEGLALYWGTEESKEGFAAFKEKRKAEFKKYL